MVGHFTVGVARKCFPNGQWKAAAVVMGPTIDNQIVRELYQAMIQADSILATKDSFASALKSKLKDIPPPVVVSPSGRVMEWLEDYQKLNLNIGMYRIYMVCIPRHLSRHRRHLNG
jgi:hypothetical protein